MSNAAGIPRGFFLTFLRISCHTGFTVHMRKIKKVLFMSLFLLLVVTLKPVSAQAPSVNLGTSPNAGSSTNTLYSNVDSNVPKNMHTLSQNVLIEVLSSVTCALSGIDPINPRTGCLGVNSNTGKLGYVTQQGGAMKIMGNLIGGTFSIPVSSGGYAQYAMSNFGITKTAYAADAPGANGVGYSRLLPLIKIWAKFRDIAYLAFVLAFTVIGLAIMFRVKIDARTVMTIQNQIPKIVIALILVTFSYAIAGFLIDIMYVITYLIILTFNSLTPTHINVNTTVFSVLNSAFRPDSGKGAHLPGAGIFDLSINASLGIGNLFSSLASDFLNSTMSKFFLLFFSPLAGLKIGCEVFSFGGNVLGNIPLVGGIFGNGPDCSFLDNFFENVVVATFSIIAFLVIIIAILYSLFRVWFTLIKSFIYVLVDAMIGPLWITAGIFPGSKLGFASWVRHLMGHLSVFPMTFAVILLGKTIMNGISGGDTSLFAPPLVGGTFGGNGTLASIVGLGFIISLPSILDKTRKAVGAIDFGLVDVKRSLGASAGLGTRGFGAATTTEVEYKNGRPESLSRPRRLGKAIGLLK